MAGAGSLSLMCESLRVGSLCLYIYICVCVYVCVSSQIIYVPQVLSLHVLGMLHALCVCVHVATWSCMWV